MFAEPSWLTFIIWAIAVLMLAAANIINLRTLKRQRKTITQLRAETHILGSIAGAYAKKYGQLDERDQE